MRRSPRFRELVCFVLGLGMLFSVAILPHQKLPSREAQPLRFFSPPNLDCNGTHGRFISVPILAGDGSS